VNVTIGGGHDFSAAFVIDESGDDQYFGSRITLGSGNATGMGFLIDNAGNDMYSATSTYALGAAGLLDPTLNAPGSPRRKINSVGVFIDAGGTDMYQVAGRVPTRIGDDRSWTGSQSLDPAISKVERAAGIDGTGDSTIHAR
jgi:hypothetical protein